MESLLPPELERGQGHGLAEHDHVPLGLGYDQTARDWPKVIRQAEAALRESARPVKKETLLQKAGNLLVRSLQSTAVVEFVHLSHLYRRPEAFLPPGVPSTRY